MKSNLPLSIKIAPKALAPAYDIEKLFLAHTFLIRRPNEVGNVFVVGKWDAESLGKATSIASDSNFGSSAMKQEFAEKIASCQNLIKDLFIKAKYGDDGYVIEANPNQYPDLLFALWSSSSLSKSATHLVSVYKSYTVILKPESVEKFAAYCKEKCDFDLGYAR